MNSLIRHCAAVANAANAGSCQLSDSSWRSKSCATARAHAVFARPSGEKSPTRRSTCTAKAAATGAFSYPALAKAHAMLARRDALKLLSCPLAALAYVAKSATSDRTPTANAQATLAICGKLNLSRHCSITPASTLRSGAAPSLNLTSAHAMLTTFCTVKLPTCCYATLAIITHSGRCDRQAPELTNAQAVLAIPCGVN
eukprot:gnl/TRDRNA2_/TRDRNA2_152798_c0_seq1.p2 gnl/TRDRNA2_/TRDRNA2_152798_c0~~gnl/TRDRNA2_/TRDRNA2_152798_c0_seq1.p2  ORF type:complete len:199 (-),score=10.91 gnl/TRDRNA2_/TRDRNA2_152798_c0_seq1:332-928(-)